MDFGGPPSPLRDTLTEPPSGPGNRSKWGRRSLQVAVLIVLIAAGFAYVWNRNAGSPDALRGKIVQIHFRDAEVADIVKECARQIKARPVIAPALKGTMSIHNTTGPLEDVMEAICRSFRCQWHLEEGPTLVVTLDAGPKDGPVSTPP